MQQWNKECIGCPIFITMQIYYLPKLQKGTASPHIEHIEKLVIGLQNIRAPTFLQFQQHIEDQVNSFWESFLPQLITVQRIIKKKARVLFPK